SFKTSLSHLILLHTNRTPPRPTLFPYTTLFRSWFGFSDNYVPDPGDYLKSIWTEIGMPDGPTTWEDLVKAAPLIKGKHPEIQIPIGIGMSQELDSNMASRAMLWSFDG